MKVKINREEKFQGERYFCKSKNEDVRTQILVLIGEFHQSFHQSVSFKKEKKEKIKQTLLFVHFSYIFLIFE